MNESKKLSALNHKAPEILDSGYNENNMHQVDKMSLDETKEIIY